MVIILNIYGITKVELEENLISAGFKKFNATQIFEWVYDKKITNFNSMTNLNKYLVDYLNQNYCFDKIKIVKKQEDVDVKKYLFELCDNNLIEAVLMKQSYGNSICISSQIGCNMGCVFCESGRLNKVRDLEAFEMVEQILLIAEDIKERIDSVVIMGIGEPLDNYDNVMSFVRIINDDKALKIGARHITISTCGIIPNIEKLAKENLQINLAISLHAPNDYLRNELMQVNKVYSLDKLMKTVSKYIADTNRRVTIEYVMLDNINDSEELALELSHLLRGLNVYVNLIPYNETNASGFKKTSKNKVMKFYDTLKKNKINVTVRKEFGTKIDAACGQLRANGVEK